MPSKEHWKQFDHVTFLAALGLIGLNIYFNIRELDIIAFSLMLAALFYDILFE